MQKVAMEFSAGMVVSRDTASHVAWGRGLSLSLDSQVADHVDSFAGCHMLERDLGATNCVNLADGRPIQLGDSSTRSAKEDGGQGVSLSIVSTIVDIEDDFPPRARLHVVVVANREHCPKVRKVQASGVTLKDVPGKGAEALSEGRWSTRKTTHAATRANRLTVAGFKV
jgi:hypothetical protein